MISGFVTYLLSEADARPSIKGKEDERVGREVLVQPFVEETVRVEFHRYDWAAQQEAQFSYNSATR